MSKRKQTIKQNQISELYTFHLKNVPQKVLIEGRTPNLPVVITLHGGPASPIPFGVWARGFFPELTDKFIMVYWDQPGCGINNYDLKNNCHINYFVEMTSELIKEIRKLFPNNKIMLWGVSWGTVLSLKVLKTESKNIHAVINYGQVLNNLFLSPAVFEDLRASKISPRKLDKIKNVTSDNFCSKDLKLISKYLHKYTEAYVCKTGRQVSYFSLIKGILTSPDYKFKDFKAAFINKTSKNMSFWSEILNINLTSELNEVSTPYYILQGSTDIVTSTYEIEKVIKASNNPNLHLDIIKNSGHIPNIDGMDKTLETLEKAASKEAI